MRDFYIAIICARRQVWDAQEEGTLANLLADQIEFADVIVLNKIKDLPASATTELQAFVRSSNANAASIETSHAPVPLSAVLGTGVFDLEQDRIRRHIAR